MIPFPVTFLLTDLLNEFYGKKAARLVTFVGFGCAVLSFVFIAAAIYFFVVTPLNALAARRMKQVDATTRPCPYCTTEIALTATRCSACTSEIESAGV